MTSAVRASSEEAFREGDMIAGRFRIEARLGAGTSGSVYRAIETPGDRAVALKVVHRELCGDRQIFGRYKREAEILRRLEGRRVVRFLDFFEFDGLLVIALEHVEGDSLEVVIKRGLSVDDAVRITLQICEGLVDAHSASVVHRDLKPANVMIEPFGYPIEGAAPSVSILDFGLAKVVHGEHMTTGLTEHDMIFGTPEYMAPEQARGDEVDARCDVYALGVMLYEMLAGTVPFERKTPLATMTAHLTESVPPLETQARGRTVNAALASVVMKALAKEPEERFASVAAFSLALSSAHAPPVLRLGGEGDELGETDLAIRLSQVPVERRARYSSDPPALRGESSPPRSSAPATAVSQRLTPAHVENETPQRGFWLVTAAIALGCAIIGAWLAMR